MTVVAKLGGSLFDQPRVEGRLSAWLAAQPRCRIVLIVGGGRSVEGLRQAHARGELTDEEAHWEAIRVMDENASELHHRLTAYLRVNSIATSAFEGGQG
ncbi:MAG: hypothetical protein KDA37_06755, partial [Planctomycetales bacterium]|nr:hypothetical protein [Planctomycetales bacterium]